MIHVGNIYWNNEDHDDCLNALRTLVSLMVDKRDIKHYASLGMFAALNDKEINEEIKYCNNIIYTLVSEIDGVETFAAAYDAESLLWRTKLVGKHTLYKGLIVNVIECEREDAEPINFNFTKVEIKH